MNRSSATVLFSYCALLSQELSEAEIDHARRVYSTEFRNSRSDSQPAFAVTAASTLVGFTLWRLRPARAMDRQRLIVHEEETKADQNITFERIGLGTRLTPNDRIRLSFETARAGYLYVASQESYSTGQLGTPHLIFPSKRMYGGTNRIRTRHLIDIPEIDNKQPYLTLQRSRPDQVAEVLTVWVTDIRIPELIVESRPLPINAQRWAEIKQKWGGQVQRVDTRETAAWTVAEKNASEGRSILRSSDPLPQNIYRAPTSGGLLFSVALALRP